MPDAFTEKFPTNFKKKLQQTNIPTANLNHFRNPGYDQLIQTAIDYSDAVCITPGTGKRLLNYIEKQEKLTLHHPEDDNYVDLYDEFYDQLIETDKTAQ
jgi:hypothetical protein